MGVRARAYMCGARVKSGISRPNDRRNSRSTRPPFHERPFAEAEIRVPSLSLSLSLSVTQSRNFAGSAASGFGAPINARARARAGKSLPRGAIFLTISAHAQFGFHFHTSHVRDGSGQPKSARSRDQLPRKYHASLRAIAIRSRPSALKRVP